MTFPDPKRLAHARAALSRLRLMDDARAALDLARVEMRQQEVEIQRLRAEVERLQHITARDLRDDVVDRLRSLLSEVALLMACESPGIDRFGDRVTQTACGRCVPCRVVREAAMS